MSKMKEEFFKQQEAKDLQPPVPDDSDYEYEIKPWRPTGWVDHPNCKGCSSECCSKCESAYEAGASAMLSALIKWLNEMCRNEKHLNNPVCPTHLDLAHKNCPQCMKQLKENI